MLSGILKKQKIVMKEIVQIYDITEWNIYSIPSNNAPHVPEWNRFFLKF